MASTENTIPAQAAAFGVRSGLPAVISASARPPARPLARDPARARDAALPLDHAGYLTQRDRFGHATCRRGDSWPCGPGRGAGMTRTSLGI